MLLRRVIESGGRSKAWLNGSPVVLAQLRAAGGMLADIHGQHAHHALLRTDAQLALVDAHGGLKAQPNRWPSASCLGCPAPRREAAEGGRLQYRAGAQAAGLAGHRAAQAAFDPDEWQHLNLEQTRLAHAAGLVDGAAEAIDGLADGRYAVVPQVERLLAHGWQAWPSTTPSSTMYRSCWPGRAFSSTKPCTPSPLPGQAGSRSGAPRRDRSAHPGGDGDGPKVPGRPEALPGCWRRRPA